MNRALFIAAIVAVLGTTFSCTEQSRAKKYGGSATETLPSGKKLVTVTWKESSLWVLTRPMKPGEEPVEYEFKESSSWGLMQGTVTIKETK